MSPPLLEQHERRRRNSKRAELKSRVIHHWPSTLVGVGLGAMDFFFEVAHQGASMLLNVTDPTSMPWQELAMRFAKASVIAGLGIFGRYKRQSMEQP